MTHSLKSSSHLASVLVNLPYSVTGLPQAIQKFVYFPNYTAEFTGFSKNITKLKKQSNFTLFNKFLEIYIISKSM